MRLKLLILHFLAGIIHTGIAQPLPIDDRVRTGVLDNGLTYFLQQNEKPEDRVEIRLALKAGSILEDEDQLGLAHFVEHMAFNGTKHFAKNELVEYLETTGARFGPDLNAYTSFDETVYMLQVRTDDKEYLNKGLLIFEDWASGLMFEHEEIDKERGVVKSEWRTRLSPDQRMSQQYYPVLYNGSRYARRLPIGDPDIIDNADYETVKRFYRDWYRPELMALVIVGDVDLDEMEKEVRERFSKIANPDAPRLREEYSVPPHEETLISIVSDEEAPFTTARMMIKHAQFKADDEDSYRQTIMHRLYNSMLNKRLRELTQQANPPFSFAYSGYGRNIGDIDSYTVFTRTDEGMSLSGLKAALIEVERANRYGFESTELQRQKDEIMASLQSAVKEQDKVPSGRQAMRYVYHYLKGNPVPSPKQQLELYKRLMTNIAVGEVNKLSEAWLTDENRVIVITGPENVQVPLPSEEEVTSMLIEVRDMEIEPYEDEVVTEPLFSRELTPGTIKDMVAFEDIDAEEWLLSNGVRVVVKPTDYQNDEVLMRVSSKGGTSLYNEEDYKHARFAASLIDQAGIAQFSSSDLEKLLAGTLVSLRPYIYESYEGLQGDAAPKDLETLFQLTHLSFVAPREDDDAFKSYIQRQASVYKNLMSNPDYFFMNHATKVKTDDSPRRGWPTQDDFNAVNFDRAVEIYKERFSDASDFVFVFVGNFEKESLKNYCLKYLATLPSTRSMESYKDLGIRYKEGVVVDEIARGEAPKTQVDLTFHGDGEVTVENKYMFNSMIKALNIKLREALREDKGGVYGVRLRGNLSDVPYERYSVTVTFNADPDQADDLIAETIRIIKQYQQEPFPEDDIVKTKESQRQGLIKNLKENRYWASRLEEAYELDYDPNHISLERLDKLQRELNADNVLKAMKQYFDWENYFKIVMRPEAAKVED